MSICLDFTSEHFEKAECKVFAAFQKGSEKNTEAVFTWDDKANLSHLKSLKSFKNFKGGKGEVFTFSGVNGETVIVIGMGEKAKAKEEGIRRASANAYKQFCGTKYKSVAINVGSFCAITDKSKVIALINEAITLTAYRFEKYLKTKSKNSFSKIHLYCSDKKVKTAAQKALTASENLASSVNYTRDLVNEAPNVLNSIEYAKRIDADVKSSLKGKGVKVKILNKADLKKEKMGLFLSVNAGSAYEPRLVHLTYTPKKATKNTKHIALVGKGLTFDTGGYSLKPGGSMVGMKFDMGGSATVYGAFRAAVLNNSPYKITCILGMTDNAVSSNATFPDSIVKGRNGTTVEILNTDAEGRLVLADCLDYACDQKPNAIIDAATLTGACLVALGTQVCAVLGNDDKLVNDVLKSAKSSDEYMWQLPIIPEWRDDMKSKIADLKNIGSTRFAGTATAAAFLEKFIKNDISWAHLDIAGVCDSASFLPYCPAKGGSGLVVRSLHHYLTNGK